jgi:hypothetical protein
MYVYYQVISLLLSNEYLLHTYIHTYHSRFIPEGVAEASQIFLRHAHVIPIIYYYYLLQ